MKLKAIIIDDESSACEMLEEMISDYSKDIEVVGTANSVSSGLTAILKMKPDVVFLDVKLSPGSGFDILQSLNEINFEIIFTTAYDRYALKAFRFSALDYLLKPIDPSQLVIAIDRAMRRIQETTAETQRGLDVLKENLKKGDSFDKIALPTSDGFIVVEIKDIIRCEGIRGYTVFFLNNKKQFVVSKKLKEIEDTITGHGFLRIFQSHLVNLNHVVKYINGRGGSVLMSDSSFIPVSRDHKTELLARLHSV